MLPRIARILLLLAPFVTLIVAQEPKLQLLPETIMKSLDNTVYVSCSAKVSDANLVTQMKWKGPHESIEIPSIDDSITTIEEGPGNLGLLIRNLKEQDVGIYTCTAVYAGNQNLEAIVDVKSFVEISYGETPILQTPIVGTDAVIKCMVTASPSPHVDWVKDGISLRTDERHIIQQDGILVRNIQESDEGVYSCRARVAELGSFETLDIQVEVHSTPEIIEPPQDISGVEKESVTFQCVAAGKPAPEYSWVDRESRPLGEEQGYYVDKVTGELTVLDLKPEQAGMYRCTATNAAGSDTAEANLRVLTKPKLESFLNITVDVQTTAEFRCSYSGDPKPEVIFKKETNPVAFTDNVNADDRIEVIQEEDEHGNRVGIMKIHGVKRSDDGLYTCSGKSTGGLTVGWGHVTVQFGPTFEQQTESEFWSLEQEKVNLTCIATSIPNATIQWYLRNKEIPRDDPNMQILALGPVGVLRVTPLDNSYYGIYTCQALNTLGSADHDVNLKQVHKPGPITSAKVEELTATTVTWSLMEPTDDGGRPITVFLVQYKRSDMSWDDADSYSWTKGSSYNLGGLEPTRYYTFRFAAKNEVGNSEWSGEKSEQMPDVTVPEEPLIFVKSEGVNYVPYTDQYDLQWKAPLDNGEPITGFTIIHYQVTNRTGPWTPVGAKTEVRTEYPGTTTYGLRNLRPDTHYRIELRAQNSIGNSQPAEIIIKTANGPQEPSTIYAEPRLAMGVIIAIIVAILLLLIIFIDLICFFSKDTGCTAVIARKIGSNEKDKEAMLAQKNISGKASGEGDEQNKLSPRTEDKEDTETTPMIAGPEGDKATIIKEEQEAKDNGEKLGQDGPAAVHVTKDSPV